MTTIAYREGKMAGDSLLSNNSASVGEAAKVWKIQGYLVGLSGTMRVVEQVRTFFEENLKPGEPLPALPYFTKDEKDSEVGVWGYVVCPARGIYRYEEHGMPWRVEAEYVAAGSGRDFAMGAMAMGATAPEAVVMAKQFDQSTGGTVRVVVL